MILTQEQRVGTQGWVIYGRACCSDPLMVQSKSRRGQKIFQMRDCGNSLPGGSGTWRATWLQGTGTDGGGGVRLKGRDYGRDLALPQS